MRGAVDARLAAPAVAAWIAGAALVALPSWWAVAALGSAALVAVLLAVLAGVARGMRPVRGRGGGAAVLASVAVALAAATLVGAVATARDGARHPSLIDGAAHRGRSVELEITVTSTAYPGDDVVRGDVRVATAGDKRVAVDVPVVVLGPVDDRLAIGARLGVTGVPRAAEPGDDAAYLVFAHEAPHPLAAPTGPLAWGDGLRARFAELATRLPGDGAALLPGLSIGDTGAVADDLDQAMKGSSLSHLTAVSGANCAVVVGIVLALARLCGVGRRARIVVAGGCLAAFVVLVTPEPSVVRAAVMAAIVLVGDLRGRSGRGLPVLCAAVVVLLAVDPWLARDYGFALSVAATAALLVLAPPLAARLERWLPAPIALLVSVPLAAQLACQPILLLLQPRVPIWGVPANLLAEPAATVATVAGLIACLLAPIAPPVALVIAHVGWLPAAWIAAVARVCSTLPGASLPWPGGVVGVAGLVVVTAVLLVALLAPPGRARRGAGAVLALFLAGAVAASFGTGMARNAGRPADWEVAGCDVGQGDAFVLRSAGRIALVDTGPEPALLRACLDDLGVGRVDLLVLTHYDLDHVGGTDAVIGRVDRALVGPVSDPDDDRLRAELAAGGAIVEQGVRGAAGSLGDLDWRLLWPPPTGVEPGNAASLTLLVTPRACACLSVLDLGDLGEESQARLLGLERAEGGLPHVDVVKVAHHGSRDQDPELYARAAAAVGLIGVGADNDYGHPTAELLATLASVGTSALRTDLDGEYLVAPGPDGGVRVWTAGARGPDRAGDGGGDGGGGDGGGGGGSGGDDGGGH
ncbi:ComEC/Rec2 family competence protein [Galbitalea sp. SE-J8]|uniref:ComEC/Rec2 family competence protein n=1 Tax=Galbitalea sp. SE-J8 TaxID=3054952 RepID=UPI00259C8D3A|nr:ComEC/Rec2 family competence protein [Galbitalea sp. SE-J8]MDM4761804.1 ComEC/Rec2 family competence protein [Galbitalea sp. SE-J8]